jgi:NhaC family Na+:H+ antiporter
MAVTPIIVLLVTLAYIVISMGSDAISDYSPFTLLGAAALAVVISIIGGAYSSRGMSIGFHRSAKQILPTVPMLIFIATVSTTWMLSGVVPTLIDYGLAILNPTFFLVTTCAVCAVISVLTGSSWSTIATIGVAFMGIGSVMGYNPGWIAGAVISGAYFGDKVSPLSDTTVLASSTCGVDLFDHIRYLMVTSMPAMGVALLTFLVAGLLTDNSSVEASTEMISYLQESFNVTPWVLIIPVVTVTMIAMRMNTILILGLSSVLGVIGMFIFQPAIVDQLFGANGGFGEHVATLARILWSETTIETGHETLNELVETSGILGMLSTIMLILCAMIFGSVMIGTGMLDTITRTFTHRLRRRRSIVGATVASGLFLNSCTGDQYLSIIIGGNMYRNLYRRYRFEPRLLSRTLEDSISVTSVLIPWNSCGVTQSTVLSVPTLTYLPFCVFNYMSPLITLLFAFLGFKIKKLATPAQK